MIWIGLTGGIGTGKSTASDYLNKKGYPVADADVEAYQAVAKGTQGLAEVIQTFGNQYLLPDGSLDRLKMAQLVFKDEGARLKLEKIIHPLVQKKVLNFKIQSEKNGAPIAFYDIPLLFEKNLETNFDFTILISCSKELQKERVRKRNSFSESEIDSRIHSQMSLMEKEKKADFVIQNNGSLEQLYQQLDIVLSNILQKAISNVK